MLETKEVKKVLRDTKMILKHNKELTIAKGEHFNLFSVLKIETRENNTHSAFLAELLNPDGSHRMGNIFLKLFLDVIGHNERFEREEHLKFKTINTIVKVEHNIGKINPCDKIEEDQSKASGGRIDIFLKDKRSENIICIENKIHADDQDAQIQRYCNYETENNTVYYLTLMGEDPKPYSCLKLKPGFDFYTISYRDEIIDWLELCLKEVPNFTGLRESINQYILLIKKLTHILNKEQQKPLNDTIIEHLEEAQYIADNYQNVVNDIREKFRKDLKLVLETELGETYSLEIGDSIKSNFAQLWLNFNGPLRHKFRYGIESFSGRGNKNGKMFIGIFGNEILPDFDSEIKINRLSELWQHFHFLTTSHGNSLNLNSTVLLHRIADEKEKKKYDLLLKTVVEQILEFINQTEKELGFVL